MADYFSNALPISGYDFGTSIPGGFASPEYRVDEFSAVAEGLAPSTSPSPSKPGISDSPFSNAWVGGSLLLEGIGNLVRGIRGMEPAPQGMATRMISDYIAQQRDEQRLEKILERIGGSKEDSSPLLAAALGKPAPLKTDNPLRGLG
jgi:hypothetical protein